MGQSEDREQYEYMKSYCPYTNLAPQGLSRHPGQDVAQRQPGDVLGAGEVRGPAAHAEDGRRPLLFKINMDAGHGGASGRYDHLREIAFDYAFILTQLGLANTKASPRAS